MKTAAIRGLYLRQITAVSPKDELVGRLRKAVRTGPGISSVRFTDNVIDNVLIEEAYIYRST